EPALIATRAVGASDLLEDRLNSSLRTGEHRRITLRVQAGLGIAQASDEVYELLRIVTVKGDDKLLIVDAVAVAGIDPNALELTGGVHVFVHHSLPGVGRKVIPGAGFDERIDEEELPLARKELRSAA